MAPKRRNLHDHLNEHAKRIRNGKDHDGCEGLRLDEHTIDEKGSSDHDVVCNGRRGAPQVIALGVEHTGDNRRERIEHYLDRKEPEEERRQVKIEFGGCIERLQSK